MFTESRAGRVAAGLIALIGWIGLAVQFIAVYGQNASVTETIWILLRYFTILANLMAAVVLSGLALGKAGFASPVLLGGVTMAMVFVGLTYVVFLRGLLELSGGARLANLILHYITPVLVLLFWLGFAPKGGQRNRYPLIWIMFPLAYGVYALARGSVEGIFAYPFIDVAQIGWPRAITNMLLLALAFLAASLAMVWLDNLMGRRRMP